MTARKRANWYEDSVDCEINKEKMWKQKPEEQKSNFWSYVFFSPCIHFRSIQSLSKFRPLVSEVLLIQFRTANEK